MKRYNMPIQRYNLLDGESYGERYQMVKEKDGDWVWWEDVEARYAELLDACESLLKFAEQDRLPTDVAVNAARAAIAKAKGEQL